MQSCRTFRYCLSEWHRWRANSYGTVRTRSWWGWGTSSRATLQIAWKSVILGSSIDFCLRAERWKWIWKVKVIKYVWRHPLVTILNIISKGLLFRSMTAPFSTSLCLQESKTPQSDYCLFQYKGLRVWRQQKLYHQHHTGILKMTPVGSSRRTKRVVQISWSLRFKKANNMWNCYQKYTTWSSDL